MFDRICCAIVALIATASMGEAADPTAAPLETVFETTVRPILQQRCAQCHADEIRKGELNLSSREGILAGSESGPVIVAGKPRESSLYMQVLEKEMPPKEANQAPLSEEDLHAIYQWIEAGALFGVVGDSKLAEVSHHDVLPILLLRCVVCHGLRVTEGGLDLRSRASILRGGKSGPSIVPGKPEESLLLKKIVAEEMPPLRRVVEVSIKPIEPTEVETIRNWIAAGAPESPLGADVASSYPDPLVSEADRQFWSFQAPCRPNIPNVIDPDSVRNPIDNFILSKPDPWEMTFSPQASRPVLLRRVFFDLIGLPPTPEEADLFLGDTDPMAYENLVDRLLASPHYGERWGRYWLDLAGYSDSNGVQNSDPIRDHIWRYRDYVIRAFNLDKPYDQFLQEQLAGDELSDFEAASVLTPEIYDNLVATGFLRMTPDGTSANITNFVSDRLEVIADELNVLSSSVLGLTLRCARCHTHKTDPIPQRDYYRLAAVFKGAYDEHDWLKVTLQEDKRGPWGTRLIDRALPEDEQAWSVLEQQIKDKTDELKTRLTRRTEDRTRVHLEERIAKLPEAIREDVRQMLVTPVEKRDEIQKTLAIKFEAEVSVTLEALKNLDPDFKSFFDEMTQQIKDLNGRAQPKPAIHALWDRGQPSPTYILRRGDHTKPGREVGPGVLSVLTNLRTPFVVNPPRSGATQTGRRLAFARWLTQPDHPLTTRVMVNRLWRHHFGAGIVRTLDNFGRTGDPPTHPELLDFLAKEFTSGSWSVKKLHRLMMTSSTYRQSSKSTVERETKDPDNKFLSRMPLRRIEAEVLRDSLLAVSGLLDRSAYGVPDGVTMNAQTGLVSVSSTRLRRTIYLLQRRTQMLTILEDFDLPPMTPNCIDRPISTVATQALHLMNNRSVYEMAEQFATRVREIAKSDPQQQIECVWRLALCRQPTPKERQLAAVALSDLTQEWAEQDPKIDGEINAQPTAADKALVNLCHAIFNSAEFLTVD